MTPMPTSQFAEGAERLDKLADALEKERTAWRQDKPSGDPKFPSHEHTLNQREETRRRDVLWENAVSVGSLLCSLGGSGAFDDEPRVKNAVTHMQAELAKARREHKPPLYYFVVNLPYGPESPKETYDVFYVKLFESYCKLAAKSPEERRAFEQYYVRPEEKAAFHIKMMRGLSRALKERGKA